MPPASHGAQAVGPCSAPRSSPARSLSPSPPPDGRASEWSALLEQVRACDDYVALRTLARRSDELVRAAGAPPGSVARRVALLVGGEARFLEAPLRVALRAAGIEPQLYRAPFGPLAAELLDPDSGLATFGPDLCVVLPTLASIGAWPDPGDTPEGAAAAAEQACRDLLEPAAAFRARAGCDVVLGTIPPPSVRPLGNLGAKRAGDPVRFVQRLNLELGDRAPEGVHLVDVAALAAARGTRDWVDLKYWYHAKQPVRFEHVPALVREVSAVAGACFGRARKALVLDLDGTLWGGLVGEDGPGGLRLGEGTPDGEAFKAFQQYVRALRERGVVLAACSKNDPEVARRAFAEHPEMVLGLDDFASFRAGWENKSEVIAAIAAELDLGLDALVFLDDSPLEREEVRSLLPQVAVPELPPDAADYPRALERGRYFEAVSLSDEDRRRTETYRARHAARELEASAGDVASFLRDLRMRGRFRPFAPVDLERVVQLTNKTNQFNLTTRRTTRAEVEARAADPHWFTRTLRLADRLTDHGLVVVVQGLVEGDVLTLDGWLMSCRVLRRGVEAFVLNEVVRDSRALGVRELRATWEATKRNGMVADLGPRLGMQVVAEGPGRAEWSLDLDTFESLETPIEREPEA